MTSSIVASKTSPLTENVLNTNVAEERTFSLFDGRMLKGKYWSGPNGDQGDITLIMLHGWLDNAGSFDVLAPLLVGSNHQIKACLALDLAGHGKSDHRNDFLPYTIWDDAIDVCALVQEQKLASVVLVGHSRGAMVASLAASIMGEQVSHLALLDSAWPQPQREEDRVSALKKAFKQRLGTPKQATRFPTQAAAIEARTQSRFPVSLKSASFLAERGVVQDGDEFIWQADPKHHLLSGVKLGGESLKALSNDIHAKAHLWIADQGVLAGDEIPALIHRLFPQVVIHRIAGNHHFHMDDAIVKQLADEILQTLEG